MQNTAFKMNHSDNMTIDDNMLVERSRQGDSKAIETLIVKYQDRLYNVIFKICGNKDDAAELTQETFVKFIEKVNTFKGRSSFYTWLFRIGVNLTINYCKRRFKVTPHSLDQETGGPDSESAGTRLREFLTDDKARDPSSIVDDREMLELLHYAVSRLSDDHRVMVVLRDIEGMTYDQIAELLKIEVGTVKSRLSRARINLRNILESLIK